MNNRNSKDEQVCSPGPVSQLTPKELADWHSGSRAATKRYCYWFRNIESPQINDELQAIFIHIPKTGGTSIRKVLSAAMGQNHRRYPRFQKHAPARLLRSVVGDSRYNRYTSFCVVRNPWDLMVSSYHWWIQLAGRHKKLELWAEHFRGLGSFDAWIRDPKVLEMVNEFRAGDLSDWTDDNAGTCIVHRILRFENLGKDWVALCDEEGWALPQLPVTNASKRSDFRGYYTPETAQWVATKFQTTIDRYGYDFDTP
ncbi:sulfotransferase family 2 domain-containing protein [Rhodopirellula bahusiensis]|uniref:sulfotransferase family 2 domain-containing protein n=1 Tax=Rhodopirellula bahusiensis TaxID=2014065 RepID=UPI003264FE78